MGDGKVDAIVDACRALAHGASKDAVAIIQTHYPFQAVTKASRKYTATQMAQVFARDGFIDRYTGVRLVFPGVLRLISLAMPDEFPFHPHGKMDLCHLAFWELFPTIDHVIPVARGGADDESNWVTTSGLSNARKANWTIEELGWALHAPGRIDDWDGLVGWFIGYWTAHPEAVAKNAYLRRWWRAAQAVRSPS